MSSNMVETNSIRFNHVKAYLNLQKLQLAEQFDLQDCMQKLFSDYAEI